MPASRQANVTLCSSWARRMTRSRIASMLSSRVIGSSSHSRPLGGVQTLGRIGPIAFFSFHHCQHYYPQSENNSGSEVVIDVGIEALGGRVVGEVQDVATPDAGQSAGTCDDQEAQGTHAPDQVDIGAFAGARFRRGQSVELEVPDEVVGEDAELLPGAVGAVVPGRDNVEGELPLELGDGLFLDPATTAKGVQGGQVQREVRGDSAVLEMAIVGGEQIE